MQQGFSHTDSLTIGRLRLPLAVAVVFIHLNMAVSGQSIHWATMDGMDFFRLVKCVVTNELANTAVPLFFIISGVLFFKSFDREMTVGDVARLYGKKLRSRVRSLLIPYIIFNVLAIVGIISSQMHEGHSFAQTIDHNLGGTKWLHCLWDSHVKGAATNILGYSKPIAYPINVPLWFMRDLMVAIIFSPIVYYAIRWLRRGWLLGLAVLAMTGIWLPWPGFGVNCWLYFSIGAWFGINGVGMSQSLLRWRWWLMTVALILMGTDIVTDGMAVDRYVHTTFLIVGSLTIYALMAGYIVRQQSQLKTGSSLVAQPWIGQCAFFVYAVHTLPLPVIRTNAVEMSKSLIWTNCADGIVCALQFVAIALVAALGCMVVFHVMRVVCPRLTNVITGR